MSKVRAPGHLRQMHTAGECRDVSIRRNLANAITLACISHVDRSVRSHSNPKRIRKCRLLTITHAWRSVAAECRHVGLPTDRRRHRFVFIPVDKESSCAAEKDEHYDGNNDLAHLVEKGFRMCEQLFDAGNVTTDVQAIHH